LPFAFLGCHCAKNQKTCSDNKRSAGFQTPARQEVKPAAQRIADRLGFKVIIERGQIAPDGVAAGIFVTSTQ